MPGNSDDRSSFENGLDRAKQVLTTIGLVVSGIVFAAGVAGLLLVINHVTGTTPPSFGSQGEWLYAAVASLFIAGWGFSQAAKFYRRRYRAVAAPDERFRLPKIQIRADGISLEMNTSQSRDPWNDKPHTWTWSIDREITPIKAIEITDTQLSTADAIAQPGVDWDTVSRHINPEYATWSAFEQGLYRHALQTSVENRRRATAALPPRP